MNSYSKLFFAFFTTLSMFYCGFAQKNISKKVDLIEKQNGKRLELYAKNNDSISYSVFLRITTTDFRRSSNRPVLSIIEPNSEKHLLTLIKLTGKPGYYEKQFIVNEVSQKLSIRKDSEDFDINFDKALKKEEITIYESENCSICEEAKTLFSKNKIAFAVKHIIKDSIELTNTFKDSKQPISSLKSQSFILKIKSKTYTNIKDKRQLIEALKSIAE